MWKHRFLLVSLIVYFEHKALLYTEDAFINLITLTKDSKDFERAFKLSEEFIKVLSFINSEREKSKLAFAKAKLDSYKMEVELSSLRETLELNELNLIAKNNEIELTQQANEISRLQLERNRYANFLLAGACGLSIILLAYLFRVFKLSSNKNKELDYQASHDPLTNCYNRRGLFQIIDRRSDNDQDMRHYCVIMTDIDHFKAINDEHGHDVGDEVLVQIVKRLKSGVRRNDKVARYGGEEFCILLPDVELNKATEIAEKLRKIVQKSPINNINVTCSFGVAVGDEESLVDAKELITQADKALYQAKTSGRNKVCVWNSLI